MRQRPLALFAAFSLYALTSPGARSQSLGQALHDAGYTETVWVNSFDRRLSYLAHGVFNPATPIHNGDYNARYGMSLSGSGTVSIGPDGYFMATGTATNPNPTPTEGDVSIDFLKSGQLEDTAEIPLTCGPLAKCPWQAEFTVKPANFPRTAMRAFTVRVYRHVEGSVCGGELTPDLNSEPCHSSVVNKFGLPAGYVFTNTDITDTNYLAKPGGTTTALCLEIRPLCSGGGGGGANPPPGADPCASWLEAELLWLSQIPNPSTGDASCSGVSAALAAWIASAPQPPPACANP
jgi:hypothetical protein